MLPKPTLTYNENEMITYVAVEDVKTGDLLTPCGLRGNHMVMQRADAGLPELALGPLFIAKHDAPGVVGQPTALNHAHALTWRVLTKNIDTTGRNVHDLVYLGDDGAYSFEPGATLRIVGKVLRVGPPSPLPNGDANSGAILLKP